MNIHSDEFSVSPYIFMPSYVRYFLKSGRIRDILRIHERESIRIILPIAMIAEQSCIPSLRRNNDDITSGNFPKAPDKQGKGGRGI